MMAPEPGKVVLVTGAGGGLGGALVTEFISHGWQVVAGLRTISTPPNSSHITPVLLDVTKVNEVEQTIATILQRFGCIDVLVNNAGVTVDALCSEISDEDWTRVLNVNLRGAFLCSRAIARQMIRQRNGHIINISSLAARRGPRGQSNYAAAK